MSIEGFNKSLFVVDEIGGSVAEAIINGSDHVHIKLHTDAQPPQLTMDNLLAAFNTRPPVPVTDTFEWVKTHDGYASGGVVHTDAPKSTEDIEWEYAAPKPALASMSFKTAHGFHFHFAGAPEPWPGPGKLGVSKEDVDKAIAMMRDAVIEHGWVQGKGTGPDGQVCTVTSYRKATMKTVHHGRMENLTIYQAVIYELVRRIQGLGQDMDNANASPEQRVIAWNDRKGRTLDDVLTLLSDKWEELKDE